MLAVCGVPASNLLLFLHLHDHTPWSARWLAFANGGAIVQPIGADAPEITARFADPDGNVLGLYQEPN